MATVKKAKAKAPAKSKPVKVRVPTLSTVRRPRTDFDVARIVLSGPKSGGKQLSVQIREAITDASIEQSIEGASTFTLAITDWSEGLLHLQLIRGAVTLSIDGLDLTLTKVSRQDTTM